MLKLRKKLGRPAGEKSFVVAVRVPVSLLARLDRHVDKTAAETGVSPNRGQVMRSALKAFLESKEY